jgi:hypothetical protein
MIKVLITFTTYVPQVMMNWQRQSTSGWSIWNVTLDVTGGTLSLLQLVFDSYALNDWSGVTGNLAKLGLASVTILFDVSAVVVKSTFVTFKKMFFQPDGVCMYVYISPVSRSFFCFSTTSGTPLIENSNLSNQRNNVIWTEFHSTILVGNIDRVSNSHRHGEHDGVKFHSNPIGLMRSPLSMSSQG